MTNIPEELDRIITSIIDEGFSEKSFSMTEDTYEVKFIKDNKTIRLEYHE